MSSCRVMVLSLVCSTRVRRLAVHACVHLKDSPICFLVHSLLCTCTCTCTCTPSVSFVFAHSCSARIISSFANIVYFMYTILIVGIIVIFILFTVHLDAPDAVLIERYAGKRVDSVTGGKLYLIVF